MKIIIIFMLLFLPAGQVLYAQSVEIKDASSESLLKVNDEGVGKSSITIQNSNSQPGITMDKLYNYGHNLYWNNKQLGIAGSAGGWTVNGSKVYLSSNVDSVGIGTMNPLFKLDVTNETPGQSVESAINANDAGGGLAAYSSTFPFPFEHFADRTSLWSNGFTASGLDLRADGATSDIRFYTGGLLPDNERMRITKDGLIGIGLDNPVAKLHIRGATYSINTARFENPTMGAHISHIHYGSTGDWYIRSAGTYGKVIIQDIGTLGAGRVGIGTSSPLSKLHISGDVRVRENGGGIRFKPEADHVRLYFQDTPSLTTSRISFYKWKTQMWGDVGIGTSNPQGMLDVNGEIYQRGSLLHADYVFEEDFKLESIQAHAQFMWKEKHLPAIPKVTVDENGKEIVEIGAHRRGIVEELEKAHIYIAQLEKRISKLEQLILKEE